MLNAEGVSTSTVPDDRNDGYGSIVSDIVALVEQVRASMERIDQAIALEPGSDIELDADGLVVLDDVTPRYRTASAPLNTCCTGLSAAVDVLREGNLPETAADRGRQSDSKIESGHQAARSAARVGCVQDNRPSTYYSPFA